MHTKTVRILNIVAGILLIAAGIYCLCNEDVAVLSAGLMLGIFMLAAGIAEIVVFAGAAEHAAMLSASAAPKIPLMIFFAFIGVSSLYYAL